MQNQIHVYEDENDWDTHILHKLLSVHEIH